MQERLALRPYSVALLPQDSRLHSWLLHASHSHSQLFRSPGLHASHLHFQSLCSLELCARILLARSIISSIIFIITGDLILSFSYSSKSIWPMTSVSFQLRYMIKDVDGDVFVPWMLSCCCNLSLFLLTFIRSKAMSKDINLCNRQCFAFVSKGSHEPSNRTVIQFIPITVSASAIDKFVLCVAEPVFLP